MGRALVSFNLYYRVIAGIGSQFSAVYNGQAIKNSGVLIIADGGIRYSETYQKLCAGARVNYGRLAGVEESPARQFFLRQKVQDISGMGSLCNKAPKTDTFRMRI